MKTMSLMLFLGLSCLAGVEGDGHQNPYPPCYDDVDECVHTLRKVMVDEDAFWFGNSFQTTCPPEASASMFCQGNTNREAKSILSRVYNDTDPARLQILEKTLNETQLAHVTFSTPEGNYYGCGHSSHTPAITYRVDPATVTAVNSWSLDHPVTVRWTANDPSTLYTVMVWDVGYNYLHALYVNAQGGNLTSADAVKPYSGPINPLPRANVYLFAVFAQTSYIFPSSAAGIMGNIMATNMGTMPASYYLSEANSYMSGDLVAANVMLILGDSYSMERQKNNYILDACPYLFTQSTEFKDVMQGSGVMANWTKDAKVVDSDLPIYISTLTVNLHAEFSLNEDMHVNACCVPTTIRRGMYIADPLSGEPARAAIVSHAPRVSFSPINIQGDLYDSVKVKTYTLLMVDLTKALYPNDPVDPVLHWLVTDIHGGDVSTGHVISEYMGPGPVMDPARVYVMFLLKQQTDNLNTSNWKNYVGDDCPDFINDRCDFKAAELLQDWNLGEISGVTWLQVEADAHTRKNAYTAFGLNMTDICNGQPGFEDPCPNLQNCGFTANPNTAHTLTFSTATSLALSLLTFLAALINTRD